MLRLALAIACFFTSCAAWQPANMMVMSRPAVRAKMVVWDNAPADTFWAKAAWETMGLSGAAMGSECIMIPDSFCPDQSRNVRKSVKPDLSHSTHSRFARSLLAAVVLLLVRGRRRLDYHVPAAPHLRS